MCGDRAPPRHRRRRRRRRQNHRCVRTTRARTPILCGARTYTYDYSYNYTFKTPSRNTKTYCTAYTTRTYCAVCVHVHICVQTYRYRGGLPDTSVFKYSCAANVPRRRASVTLRADRIWRPRARSRSKTSSAVRSARAAFNNIIVTIVIIVIIM